jgi:ABC-type multidrug transport system fused ATPase/permease subunit
LYSSLSLTACCKQEPTLFSSTIAENIAYGAVDPTAVTVQQITEAARMANAQSFIDRFPKGIETVVGERGIMLSGEQKILAICHRTRLARSSAQERLQALVPTVIRFSQLE